ncbi:MAG: hypothetical protein UHS47_05840 [Oscillospiraceae bacterium]|nr:hypothetical protein [Oscillospiraceae bacterium]
MGASGSDGSNVDAASASWCQLRISGKYAACLCGCGINITSIPEAQVILGMLPLIIVYCCMQKHFIEGVSAGSVKE